ncbi:MAG: hypothetical protein HYY43_04185 [Deltaproteobacteria bacterium]|nr:hypothetical protein [Deltaproteobacteria bacterium]MBI2342471.1 hypothetical protein [Deltaproteobacteria bacterium]MBI2974768.1 hypothetical protein [Deltaproteobacteria bacterium]
MKIGIINKINRIRSKRPSKSEDERPYLRLPVDPPSPRQKEPSKEAPAGRVIIIDLM